MATYKDFSGSSSAYDQLIERLNAGTAKVVTSKPLTGFVYIDAETGTPIFQSNAEEGIDRASKVLTPEEYSQAQFNPEKGRLELTTTVAVPPHIDLGDKEIASTRQWPIEDLGGGNYRLSVMNSGESGYAQTVIKPDATGKATVTENNPASFQGYDGGNFFSNFAGAAKDLASSDAAKLIAIGAGGMALGAGAGGGLLSGGGGAAALDAATLAEGFGGAGAVGSGGSAGLAGLSSAAGAAGGLGALDAMGADMVTGSLSGVAPTAATTAAAIPSALDVMGADMVTGGMAGVAPTAAAAAGTGGLLGGANLTTGSTVADNLIKKAALSSVLGGGSTGTRNMATGDNNLSSLIGGLLGGGADLLRGSTNNEALQQQANELKAAGQQAATASQFRPVGTTTTFGTSNFQVDPVTGQLQSAGYQLSPQLQQYQNQLMAGGQQSLTDAANLQNLGRGYIAQSPEAAAQQYMANQQALLAPSRDMESARLANQLQQTGRTGVSVAQGGSLGMANPEQQALANARALQDLNLAAQAQQQGRAQTTFGQGLLSSAYDPFNAGLTTAKNVEALGQQPLGLSTDLAKQFQQANATGAKYNLAAQEAATKALYEKNTYNPYADLLSGASGNKQLTGALGGLLGNTGAGQSLVGFLNSLGGSNLNNAASDYMNQNPDIVPSSTFNGSGDASWMNDWWMGGPNQTTGYTFNSDGTVNNSGYYDSLTATEKQNYFY
jgi:hypothetical protein